MKTYLMMGLALGSLMTSSTSHALVRVVLDCQTVDNRYSVSILDNEGIGLVRTENLVASITDENGLVVGTYAVEQRPSPAIGFGDPYLDKKTSGKRFELSVPDTNIHGYAVRAILDGDKGSVDDRLTCSDL